MLCLIQSGHWIRSLFCRPYLTTTLCQVPSVISRVRALWRHVREARAAFEGSPDTGLFSKSVTRCLHIFVNYVLKGALGTAFLSLVLPPLIVACSFVSLLLALTSPVTVWGCSAVLHVLGCLFYDFEVGAPLNALLWNLAINGVLLGLIQPVLAGIVAFVLCPLGSLVLAVSGVLRKGCRNSWDAIVYLVRRFHLALSHKFRSSLFFFT